MLCHGASEVSFKIITVELGRRCVDVVGTLMVAVAEKIFVVFLVTFVIITVAFVVVSVVFVVKTVVVDIFVVVVDIFVVVVVDIFVVVVDIFVVVVVDIFVVVVVVYIFVVVVGGDICGMERVFEMDVVVVAVGHREMTNTALISLPPLADQTVSREEEEEEDEDER